MNKAYFIDIQSVLLSEIGKAEKTLDVAVAWFSSKSLFDLVCTKLDQGLTIRLAIRNDYKNNHDRALDWQNFISKGGSLYVDDNDSLHHKYCVIDNNILITGSYNWTNNAAYRSIENILIVDQLDAVAAYTEDFILLIDSLLSIRVNKRIEASSIPESVRWIYEKEIELDLESNVNGLSDDNILEMGLYLYRKKQYQEAEKLLLGVSQNEVSMHQANSLLAAIYLEQNHYQESIEFGKNGLVGDPKLDADTHNTIASAYCELKKYTEARRHLDQSITLDANVTTWYANKIEILLELGLHTEADKVALHFKELAANVVRANKGLFNRAILKARIELGGLSQQTGSYADADKYAEQAKEIYIHLSNSEQDLHDLDDIDKLLKHQPTKP
jgi:tetratricopeptide (TPR) repeat protein